jgi:hypothetical protein
MSTTEQMALHDVRQRLGQFFRLRGTEIAALLKQTINAWFDDNVPRLGFLPLDPSVD